MLADFEVGSGGWPPPPPVCTAPFQNCWDTRCCAEPTQRCFTHRAGKNFAQAAATRRPHAIGEAAEGRVLGAGCGGELPDEAARHVARRLRNYAASGSLELWGVARAAAKINGGHPGDRALKKRREVEPELTRPRNRAARPRLINSSPSLIERANFLCIAWSR